MPSKIKDYFQQDENNLICKKTLTLTLDKSTYNDKNKIQINNKNKIIWVKSVIAKVEFDDIIFSLVLDYSAEFYIYKDSEITKEFIKLQFPENSTVLSISTEADEIKGQIQYIERLLGGREILKDPPHLYKKIMAVYSSLSRMDSVHLEVLCSQVLRDKINIHKPARLSKNYDPILVNIKKVVFATSFMSGLAFENFGESVRQGLITDDTVDPTIIEKVMTGDIIEK